jgi:glycosyltransferase involved in cell wall biosynthesis
VEDSLPVVRVPRPPQGRLLRRRYLPYLTHPPFSYLALRAGSYDVAHALYPSDALAAARWAKRAERPAVFSYMGIPDRPGLCEHRYGLEVMARAVRGCDAVVALSRYAADAFAYWLGCEARIIPPGVDLETFRPLPSRSPSPTIVCSAAADVPRKNVGLLIEAFSLLRRERPEARLILSRPGDPATAKRAGVRLDAPGVQWANLDERPVLARVYGEAWAAALPSTNEAFGLALLEALACGTPAVGSAHGAIPEVIDRPGIGKVVDPLEPETLTQALLETFELASDTKTAVRCRARAEELSSERCADRYLTLYRELLRSNFS